MASTITFLRGLMLVSFLSASMLAAATPAKVIRSDVLRSEPRSDASVLAELPADGTLQIFDRRGGWYRATAAGQRGWVRIYWVRPSGEEAAPEATGKPLQGISDAARLARERRNSSNVVANIGVRGINEEDLKSAHFDAAQIAKLEQNQVDANAARSFASDAKLAAHNVAELAARK